MKLPTEPAVTIPLDGCYIWWTTQGDCESAMRSTESYVNGKSIAASRTPGGSTIPKYVLDNLAARYGRNAEGTVWGHGIDTTINTQLKDKWKNEDFHRLLKRYCGGVLFYKADAPAIFDNVGFVTDLDLKLILR